MPHDREQSILKQLAKLGQEPPDIIKNKPELVDDELFLWKSYIELSTERPLSSDQVCHIPITKIYEYAEHVRVPDSYLCRFLHCIRGLDIHNVSVQNDKLEQMRADARARRGNKR